MSINKMRDLMLCRKGQGLVEYALIIALIAVVLVVSLNALKGGIAGRFAAITAAL